MSFVEEYLGRRIETIAELLDRIKALDDCQYELLLLRYIAGFPKFNFALRTAANTPLAVGRCPDCEGITSDVKGIHDTICKSKGKVVRRHDKVCKTLKDICAQAHIVCTREDSDLL